jgi:serine/threonine protein kinase
MNRDPLIGQRLANFQIDGVIGRGGMAQVYHGWDIVLRRPVAIKVIDVRYRAEPTYAERFVKEAQAVATWRHENIVQIYYASDENGLYYFVMEYIDGLDLGKFLERCKTEGPPLSYADVLRIGRAIANALDYAHRQGVIHRDVKPSNVILANDGRVVLTDFGLAMDVAQGSLGEVVGTARYTAPEQARRSSAAIPQSDLYSLGVVLYEMLTGTAPFDDPSPTSVALQHMTLPPPPPRSINPALNEATETVLLKALSKSPHDRYPTGSALIDALENALQVRPPAPAKRFSLPVRPSSTQLPAAHSLGPQAAGDMVTHTTTAALPPVSSRPAPTIQREAKPSGVWRYLFLGAAALILVGVLVISLRGAAPWPASQPTEIVTPDVPTLAPALVNASQPIATALPANAAPPSAWSSPTAMITPTVLYPDGRHFVIFYNDNSLYLYNAAGKAGETSPLAFERLDASGTALNRFDGWHWSQHYPRVEADSCVRVELRGSSPYLRPTQCQGRYNSSITASRTDSDVFWTSQKDSNQFRVLWNKQEIARCEIAAGMCEVFLP